MKNLRLGIILNLFILSLFLQSADAQVTGVNYQLKYNEKSDLFDCYMVVKQGSAKSMRDRVQFNAQYTVVVPTGSKVEIAQNYMPLQNNQNYGGTRPLVWTIANESLRPAVDPFNDYISITPTLSPASFYNDIAEGESVKLFSLKISTIFDCGRDIRLFENGMHPSSRAEGMSGGDFSNGFTLGGVQQRYLQNEPTIIPTIDVVKDIKVKQGKSSVALDLNVTENNPYAPFTYTWTAPNGSKSYEQDFLLSTNNTDINGKYTVEVTDARGCKQTKEIIADIKTQVLSVSDVTPSEKDQTVITERIRLYASNVDVYPNPANSFFNLSISADHGSSIVAEITDINGRSVNRNIINTTLQGNQMDTKVSVEHLAPGNYNVVVKINDKLTTQKLIIVR